MHSQVRQLDLKLSLPQELRPQTTEVISRLRTGFLNRVVESIEDRFHAEYGSDAVIEIEDLVVRWDGAESAVADYDVARRVGEDIIAGVLSEAELQSVGANADKPSSQAAKIYKSAVHRSTVRIAALARKLVVRTTATDVANTEAEWLGLMESGADAVRECAQYLAKHTNVDDIVSAMRPRLLRQLTKSLPLTRWPMPIRAAIVRNYPKLSVPESGSLPKTPERETNDVEPRIESGEEHPGGRLPDQAGNHERVERSDFDMDDRRNGEKYDADAYKVGSLSRQETNPGEWRVAASGDERDGRFEPDLKTRREDPATALTADPPVTPVEGDDAELYSQSVETNFAGLMYVLNLIRRIELPEILWCCGIDERSFLFDLFRELVGPEGQDDPIIFAVSGIAPDRENYQRSLLPRWAFDEVFSKTERNLFQLLSVSTLPLNATPREQHEAGMGGSEDSGFWTDLTLSLAAIVGDAFLKLVDTDGAWNSLQEIILVDGFIRDSGGEIGVDIPLELMNIDVRRVALDANPGRLEWQERRLDLVFAGVWLNRQTDLLHRTT